MPLTMNKFNNKKLNVVVLMGGPSAEHEISLKTGQMVLKALDKSRYNLKPVAITKEGKWLLPPANKFIEESVKNAGSRDSQALVAIESGRALDQIKAQKSVDVVLIAMHGPYGEDGTIQGLLELAGIPYTCSGVLASALAMDKVMTKKILRTEKILMPRHIILEKNHNKSDLKKIKLPVVMKPIDQGSSVGTFVVKTKKEIEKAVKEAFKFGPKLMIEEFIDGREITAAVLGNAKPRALPLIEIKPLVSPFFDYRAKYEVGGSQEICPAPLSKKLTKEIQKIAVEIHQALGCRGVTRSDFILRGSKPYFLEINTIPGMTETSLVPQAAAKAGIPFPKLLDKLIELALEK